jgi:putative ABC transport system substrate-binding protein
MPMHPTRFISALLLLFTLEVLVAPTAAEAQRAGKVPRIGVLAVGLTPFFADFHQGLRELGYVEGDNLVVEYRLSDGKVDRLPELARR